MAIKIIMDSGVEYISSLSLEQFNRSSRNGMGILLNVLIDIKPGVFISPQHVSSIEEINS